MTEMETEPKQTGYPSIDKPWLKYYTKEALAGTYVDSSIYLHIYDCMKKSHFESCS